MATPTVSSSTATTTSATTATAFTPSPPPGHPLQLTEHHDLAELVQQTERGMCVGIMIRLRNREIAVVECNIAFRSIHVMTLYLSLVSCLVLLLFLSFPSCLSVWCFGWLCGLFLFLLCCFFLCKHSTHSFSPIGRVLDSRIPRSARNCTRLGRSRDARPLLLAILWVRPPAGGAQNCQFLEVP